MVAINKLIVYLIELTKIINLSYFLLMYVAQELDGAHFIFVYSFIFLFINLFQEINIYV